jgi:uncharacterized protein (DUF1810 family)/gamma-glutamylcyclotransferase (GGCT)/AIG2-like uncharacterized protein YtfP
MPLLFSYGMLQQPEVQLCTFGRLLQGQIDELSGYELTQVKIRDACYANIIINGKTDGQVRGVVYEVAEAELAAADRYEQNADYRRTLLVLASGKKAWVYRATIAQLDSATDPFDLDRFIDAQAGIYQQALAEIKSARKRSHWMWFIFPQLDGLGFSAISKTYAIKSSAEATAYLHHPILGPRLVECAEALLRLKERSAFEIFGNPDDLKLRSCATLFASVSPEGSAFERLLEKFFAGKPDDKTLHLLGLAR